MKRNWSPDELIASWTLLPLEAALLDNKTGPTRLGFAVLFKFFQLEARFPAGKNEIPRIVVAYVAKQVGVNHHDWLQYDWRGRSIKYRRAQIRDFFGFREATLDDEAALGTWLGDSVLAHEQDLGHLEVRVLGRLRQQHIEPPTPDQVERLIRSALHTYDESLFARINSRLSDANRQRLKAILWATGDNPALSVEAATVRATTTDPSGWNCATIRAAPAWKPPLARSPNSPACATSVCRPICSLASRPKSSPAIVPAPACSRPGSPWGPFIQIGGGCPAAATGWTRPSSAREGGASARRRRLASIPQRTGLLSTHGRYGLGSGDSLYFSADRVQVSGLGTTLYQLMNLSDINQGDLDQLVVLYSTP